MITFTRSEIDYDEDLIFQTLCIVLGFPAPKDGCWRTMLDAALPHMEPGEIADSIAFVKEHLAATTVTPSQEDVAGDASAFRNYSVTNQKKGATVNVHEGVGAVMYLQNHQRIDAVIMAKPGDGIAQRLAYLHSSVTATIAHLAGSLGADVKKVGEADDPKNKSN